MLRAFDLQSGRPRAAFQGHDGIVRSVGFAAGGRFAVSASEDRTLRFWEVQSGRCVHTEPAAGQVLTVSVSADGRWAAAGTYDRRVLLFELEWE